MGNAAPFVVVFALLLVQDGKDPIVRRSYAIDGLASWCGEDPRLDLVYLHAVQLVKFTRILFVDALDPKQAIVAAHDTLTALLPSQKQNELRAFLDIQRKRASGSGDHPTLEIGLRVALVPKETLVDLALPTVPRLLKTPAELQSVEAQLEGLELSPGEARLRTWQSTVADSLAKRAEIEFHGTVLDYDAERYAILGSIDAKGCPSIPVHAILAPGITALAIGPEIGRSKPVALITVRAPRPQPASRPASR